MFALQNGGQCFGGKDADRTFMKYGVSKTCRGKDIDEFLDKLSFFSQLALILLEYFYYTHISLRQRHTFVTRFVSLSIWTSLLLGFDQISRQESVAGLRLSLVKKSALLVHLFLVHMLFKQNGYTRINIRSMDFLCCLKYLYYYVYQRIGDGEGGPWGNEVYQ